MNTNLNMQTDKRTLLLPPCKINIGLNVVARRADGYHDLETVFYPVPLRDNLEFKISDDDTAPYTLSTGVCLWQVTPPTIWW